MKAGPLLAAAAVIFGGVNLSSLQAEGPNFPRAVFTGYDEKADRLALIDAAISKARVENRRVLLIFGANWCGPCRKLHGLLHDDRTISGLLAARYVVVFVDVNGVRNRELEARYGDPVQLGIPVLEVLSADGKLLKTQSSREFAEGNHQDGARVLEFLRTWAGGR